MNPFPDTRLSLIARLQGAHDPAAWEEFVSMYWQVLCRLARRKGLQHADAEDLAQQVLLAVAKAVKGWTPDQSRAPFRAWLRRIADNLALNALSRRKPEYAHQAEWHELASVACPEDSYLLHLEYRREIFLRAARGIEREFAPDSWQAFWRTAVQGIDIEEAARQLDKSVGAIYAARSRVMRRLKAKVLAWEAADALDQSSSKVGQS